MRPLLAIALSLFAFAASRAQQPGTVHTPEADLATYTYGRPSAATPILAVNGGPGLSHVYMIQNSVWTTRIAAQRQVVFYDQRGTGASQPLQSGASMSMDAQIADLEAVRASLHREKVHLVGDSYGGLLASAYAAAHPEHVLTLILSDSAAPGIPLLHPRLSEVFPDLIAQTKDDVAKLQSQPDSAASTDRIADLNLRLHFRMIFYSQPLADRYLANAKDLGSNRVTGAAVSKAIATLDLTPQMAQFHFPTLILQGRFDLNVTPDIAYTVAHTIPGAQLVWFEQSGHLPYYEEPEKYAATVNHFLTAHEKR